MLKTRHAVSVLCIQLASSFYFSMSIKDYFYISISLFLLKTRHAVSVLCIQLASSLVAYVAAKFASKVFLTLLHILITKINPNCEAKLPKISPKVI